MSSVWNGLTRLQGFVGSVLLASLFLLGCGSGKDATGGVAQYYGNYHKTGWLGATPGQPGEHAGQAVADVASCTKCHEISIIKTGSGVPTCMTTGCHHKSTPNWADGVVHGRRAARLPVDGTPGLSSDPLLKDTGLGGYSGGLVSCQICHGTDYSGGVAAKSCSSCHIAKAPHPQLPWFDPSSKTPNFKHSNTHPSNAVVCAQCHLHGANYRGSAPTMPPAGTPPGCTNMTLCHGENPAPHPLPFLAPDNDVSGNGHMNATAATFLADCSACHAQSGTSPVAAAPACSTCHTQGNPTVSSAGAGTCLSCHVGAAGLPAGPTGGTFPNIAGAHAKHLALATALNCNTCHAGAGTGTTAHYTKANARVAPPTGPATVSIDPTFKAKSGGNPTFTASNLTCSNVSCHGGQTAPDWRVGTITSATQCTACHGVVSDSALATQFNDAFGRHSQGTHNATNGVNGISCTTCHAMNNGSPGANAHFAYLNTAAVDGTSGIPVDQLPSGTIVFDPAATSGARTYTTNAGTQGNGGCALTCHTHLHTAVNETWKGLGVSHTIPFGAGVLDDAKNGHFTVTSAQFAADCATCHSYTGTSLNPKAPLCSTCHTLANPTTAGTGTGTCLSCHSGASGLPAGPVGTTFPGITGAHPKHMALPNVACDTCHAGRGTGTTTHYNNANVRVLTPAPPTDLSINVAYSAKNGSSPAYVGSSLTCSSVRCHGGQATPAWRGGTINSATQCTLCHNVATTSVTATQYNDAFGRHSGGTHNALTTAGVACTTCHNMANNSPGALAHFKYLNTVAVDALSGGPADQLPSGTIVFDASVTGAKTYTTNAGTQGNGGCALTCHTHIHTANVNMWASVGVPHPKPFLAGGLDNQSHGHLTVTAAEFAADCIDCHAYTGTSPVAAAPLCSTCHTVANPTLLASGAGTCLSCHAGTPGLPQGPGGLAFPSIPGAHATHMGLATTLTCNTCHAGRGSTTLTHYNNADPRVASPAPPSTLAIDVTYQAKSPGTAPVYTGSTQTCSNVSCHGGPTSTSGSPLPTPPWTGGNIDSSTQCMSCHNVATTAGTVLQYNDAFGKHSEGTHNAAVTANGVACTTCHDMTNNSPGGTSHFKYLNTPAVDGVAASTPANQTDQMPSGTISFATGFLNGGTGTYNVNLAGTAQGNGACTLTCHIVSTNKTHIHTGVPVDTWTASGAPHQVPFYSTSPADAQGNGHMTVTAAAYAQDCVTCHAYSGTSPNAGAPLCQSCHTRNDPTQPGFGAGTCLSCHVGGTGLPAGPTDTQFPNIAGAHAKHMALAPESAVTCNSCHANSGSGTTVHYVNAKTPTANPAPVAIDTLFNAQTGGAAAFAGGTALTCSNVSCHGGKVTPSWRTAGSLNSLTQCSACHGINGTASPSQYNDAVGRHAWGTHFGAATADCTICHSMDPSVNTSGSGAQNHFAGLELHALSGPTKRPSNTIVFKTATNFPILAGGTYNVTTSPFTETDGGCAVNCHAQNHVPGATTYHWGLPQGSGAPHPSPFLLGQTSSATGNTHQTVTQAQFTSECSNCHEVNNPTSTYPGPTCTKCHTQGSPFASALGTCLSCHIGTNFSTSGPQGPTTQIWPNKPGAHAKHLTLLTFTRGTQGSLSAAIFASTCSACHLGSLPGDTGNTHYANARKTVPTPITAGPAPVSFDGTFKSKNGAGPTLNPSFTATNLTCSNVSCHGGKVTPAWTSTYTVNGASYCLSCHAISTSANYNDARGTHSSGSHPTATCVACHDMSATTNNKVGVTNHFKYLDTTIAAVSPDQRSADTIKLLIYAGTGTNGTVSGGTYTPTSATSVGTGNCALTCHVGGTTKTHSANSDGNWTSNP